MRLLAADLAGAVITALKPRGCKRYILPGSADVCLADLGICGRGRRRFRLDVPARWATTGGVSALMNLFVANGLEFGGLTLDSLDLPGPMLRGMPGPMCGIAGIRAIVAKPTGPLFGVALKPNMFPRFRDKVRVAESLARAGVDIIKDDEVFHEDPGALVARATAIQQRILRVRRQVGRACYVPNVSGDAVTIRHLEALAEGGVRGVMLTFLTAGWYKVFEFRRRAIPKLFLYGHRAMHEAVIPYVRMPVLALLSRLAGLDLLHVGTPTSASALRSGESFASVESLQRDLPRIRRSIPVFSKTTGTLGKLLHQHFGQDVLLMACGAIYSSGDLEAAARQWIQKATT